MLQSLLYVVGRIYSQNLRIESILLEFPTQQLSPDVASRPLGTRPYDSASLTITNLALQLSPVRHLLHFIGRPIQCMVNIDNHFVCLTISLTSAILVVVVTSCKFVTVTKSVGTAHSITVKPYSGTQGKLKAYLFVFFPVFPRAPKAYEHGVTTQKLWMSRFVALNSRHGVNSCFPSRLKSYFRPNLTTRPLSLSPPPSLCKSGLFYSPSFLGLRLAPLVMFLLVLRST